LRAIKKQEGAALVPHPADVAMPVVSHAAIAAGLSDAELPVSKIVGFLGSFHIRYQTRSPGFRHWRVGREVP
jgi:hypothetical protein